MMHSNMIAHKANGNQHIYDLFFSFFEYSDHKWIERDEQVYGPEHVRLFAQTDYVQDNGHNNGMSAALLSGIAVLINNSGHICILCIG